MADLYGTSLVLTDNISLTDFDADPFVLDGAYHSASAQFGGVTYVYIADRTSDAIRVYTLSEAGELDQVATINDTGGITLGGANRLVVFEVDDNPFLAVTGEFDHGITTFALTGSAPYLTFADRAFDSDSVDLNLAGASGIEVEDVFGGGTYLYVAGVSSGGISVFEVDSSGGLTNIQNIDDGGTLELAGATGMATFSASLDDYLVVTGRSDTGITIFEVLNNGELTEVASLDGAALGILSVPIHPAAVEIDRTGYIYVPEFSGDAITVLSFDGTDIEVVQRIESNTALRDGWEAEVISIGDRLYLSFSNGSVISQLHLFEIDTNPVSPSKGGLTPLQSVSGPLNSLRSSELVKVGDAQFIVTTANSGGTSVFEVGGGDDEIVGTSSPDRIYGGGGDDTLSGLAGLDRIYGGAGDDLIYAGSGPNFAYGGDGDDVIHTGSGNSFTYGGAGDDVIHGGSGDNTVYGDDGNDVIHGGSGDDDLRGGDGSDRIFGGSGGDILRGENGDDVLFGLDDNDTLAGNNGDDRLHGGAGNDRIFGGANADTIHGGSGDDFIEGGTGFDLIHGDSGNDEIYGQTADDTIYGGSGNDALYGGSNADLLRGGSGADTLHGDSGFDTLYGGAGNDEIYGGTADDLLDGGSGDDMLYGGAQDDTLKGTVGADHLDGGSGDDLLYGGSDNDTLIGGEGQDMLYGGWGADVFIWNSASESPWNARDTISDFTPGEDLIDISAIHPSLAWTPGGFTGVAGQVWYSDATGTLWVDMNGSGNANFGINLDGSPVIDAGDVIL